MAREEGPTGVSAAKRRRTEACAAAAGPACGMSGDDAEEAALDAALLRAGGSDVLVAVQLLVRAFPKQTGKAFVPFALQSQLHALVKDKAAVEGELEQLRLSKQVRVFKLGSGRDDFGVALASDYRAALLRARGAADTGTAAFDAFVEALDEVLDLAIAKEDLVGICLRRSRAGGGGGGGDEDPDGAVEDALTQLVRWGFLAQVPSEDSDLLAFSIPHLGPVVRSIVKGRKELARLFARKRHKEILEKDLLKGKLQGSAMGMQFHLHDAVGSKWLATATTTAGTVYRLTTAG